MDNAIDEWSSNEVHVEIAEDRVLEAEDGGVENLAVSDKSYAVFRNEVIQKLQTTGWKDEAAEYNAVYDFVYLKVCCSFCLFLM